MGRRKKRDGGEAAEGADAEGTKKGSKKKLLIPLLVVIAGLGVGSKVMGGGGGAAAAIGPTTTTTAAPGPVDALEPITLNLADGRYLKVGLALQLLPDADAPEPTANQKVSWAKAFHLAIGVFGGRTYPQLVDPAGRDQARLDLEAALRAAYPELVESVYFTEFVLQ